MIEVMTFQNLFGAAIVLGTFIAASRILKEQRQVRKDLKALGSRVEPKLSSLASQVGAESVARQLSDNLLDSRVTAIERARMNDLRPGGDTRRAVDRAVDAYADRAGSKPFGGFPSSKAIAGSSSSRSSSSETPLSSPLHPANPASPIYDYDDTPSRSSNSGSSYSSHSGSHSSSCSSDSGSSSSSDSGSCSSD